KLDEAVPSPAQFDHVITAARIGPGLTWLDATAEVAPYGMLLYVLRDKEAVVAVDSAGGGLQRTPGQSPVEASIHFTLDGKLTEFGTLDANVELTSQGDRDVPMRAGFRNVPQARWKEFARILSTSWGFTGDVDDLQVDPLEDTSRPFRMKYHVRI